MDKERRKFKRFDAYMSVKYQVPGQEETKGISLSKDLSREGLKINSNSNMKEGTVLDLEINIPDDPKPVHTSGKVMWSHPSEGRNQGFDQGVRFVMMDPVDKFRVLDYAYNHWLETKVNDFSDPEGVPELG
jgi:c-di-GMP-binding flagellar brake protein YcgR